MMVDRIKSRVANEICEQTCYKLQKGYTADELLEDCGKTVQPVYTMKKAQDNRV